jgi:hypothetical protein
VRRWYHLPCPLRAHWVPRCCSLLEHATHQLVLSLPLRAGCSTVLVPARVVQALNLNLDDLGAQPRYPGGFVLDHGNQLFARPRSVLSVPCAEMK